MVSCFCVWERTKLGTEEIVRMVLDGDTDEKEKTKNGPYKYYVCVRTKLGTEKIVRMMFDRDTDETEKRKNSP